MKNKARAGWCSKPQPMQQQELDDAHMARHHQQFLPPTYLPLPCLQPALPDSICIFDCVTCHNIFSSNSRFIPLSAFPIVVSLATKPDNAGAAILVRPVPARPKRYN